jgi:hypothetical protein
MRALYLRRILYQSRWIVLEIGHGGCKTDARPRGLYEQVGIVARRWAFVGNCVHWAGIKWTFFVLAAFDAVVPYDMIVFSRFHYCHLITLNNKVLLVATAPSVSIYHTYIYRSCAQVR